MPDYGDIRQRTILAIESQGADALTIIGDGISELQKKQRDLSGEFQAGGVAADGYIKKMQALEAEVAKLKAMYDEAGNSFDKMSDLQKKLGEMQKRSEAETRGAILDSAAARRAGTEAIVDHIARTRQEIAADNEAAAAMDREHDELEALNKAFQNNVQNVGMATRATREQVQALKDMGIIADTTTPKIKKAGDASQKTGDQGQKAGQAAARGFLELSRAVEDFAVAGPLGALNNMPGIADSIGRSFSLSAGAVAGITAGVSALATISYVVYQNWDRIADSFGRVDARAGAFVTTVDEAKGKLEALQAKPYKVELDYTRISEAERLVETLEARMSAFQAGRRDNLTEEASKLSRDATHAYGGGTEQMMKAVAETESARGVSHADQNLVDQLRAERKLLQEIKDFGSEDPKAGLRAQENITRLSHQIGDQERTWAQGEVGAFNLGDFQAIGRMQSRARQFPGAFNRVGPGGVTSGEAIANLPGNSAEMLRRIDQEEDQKRNDESMAEFVQQNRRANQKIKAGAKTSEDAEERHHTNIHGEFEQGLAEFRAKSDAMQARSFSGEARAMTREEKAQAADFGKLKDVGKGEAERVRQQNLGRIFQQETGANDQTSAAAGKGMDASMAKGFSMQQAFLAEIRKLGGVIARQAADIEAANEAFGQAAGAIGQISAKQSMSGKFQQRGGIQNRTFFPNFGG